MSDVSPKLRANTSVNSKIGVSISSKPYFSTTSDAVFVTLFGWISAVIIRGNESFNWISFALIGLILSLLGQIGDLVASAIKRQYGIKDYGRLFPGHGGVLDRFDSNLMTAPILFLVCYWIF